MDGALMMMGLVGWVVKWVAIEITLWVKHGGCELEQCADMHSTTMISCSHCGCNTEIGSSIQDFQSRARVFIRRAFPSSLWLPLAISWRNTSHSFILSSTLEIRFFSENN